MEEYIDFITKKHVLLNQLDNVSIASLNERSSRLALWSSVCSYRPQVP